MGDDLLVVAANRQVCPTGPEIHFGEQYNRQSNDVGPQYRSVIIYHNDAQKQAAEKSKADEQKRLSKPIVTEIVPLKKFFRAEAYHQDYFRNHPEQGYCQVVIRPKVDKVKKLLKEQKR